MNERIRELMSQAGFDPAAIERMGVMPQAEKFTELIVRECVSIVNVWSDEEPCAEGYDILTVSKIKQHFGVE